jgi:hypothetical protein
MGVTEIKTKPSAKPRTKFLTAVVEKSGRIILALVQVFKKFGK